MCEEELNLLLSRWELAPSTSKQSERCYGAGALSPSVAGSLVPKDCFSPSALLLRAGTWGQAIRLCTYATADTEGRMWEWGNDSHELTELEMVPLYLVAFHGFLFCEMVQWFPNSLWNIHFQWYLQMLLQFKQQERQYYCSDRLVMSRR